jgi:superfamily II DNA/RNA helicase
MVENIYGQKINYVNGSTDIEIRDSVKKALINKEIMIVICTVASGGVWREGINIPSLNVVINASGGESELGLIQSIGRGMRVAEGKWEVDIVDFLDTSHYYLIKHFGGRMIVYSEMGWILNCKGETMSKKKEEITIKRLKKLAQMAVEKDPKVLPQIIDLAMHWENDLGDIVDEVFNLPKPPSKWNERMAWLRKWNKEAKKIVGF